MFWRPWRNRALTRQFGEIARLKLMLLEANECFDELTGGYPKWLVREEEWRKFRNPLADTDEEERWEEDNNLF